MTIPFFNNVLSALGRRVNYDAVVNYAGNSFAKDSWKMIESANPLVKPKKLGSGFIDMLSKVPICTKRDEAKVMEGIEWAT